MGYCMILLIAAEVLLGVFMDILLKYTKLKKGSAVTAVDAKKIIKSLGMSGKSFSMLFDRNTNYVSNFSREGVPSNIAIILKMWEHLAALDVKNEEIINIISSEIKKN